MNARRERSDGRQARRKLRLLALPQELDRCRQRLRGLCGAGCPAVVPLPTPCAWRRPGWASTIAPPMRWRVLAMDQYGCAARASQSAFERARHRGGNPERVALRRGAGLVASADGTRGKDIPWCWDVTSDSLAAWLAGPARRETRRCWSSMPSVATGPLRAEKISWRAEFSIRLFRVSCAPAALEASIAGPAGHSSGCRAPSATGNWSAPASTCVSCIPLR